MENLNQLIIQMIVEYNQPLEYLENLPIGRLLKLADGIAEYVKAREEYRRSMKREG